MVVIAVMVMMTVRSQLVLDCKRDYPIRSVVMYRDPQATGGMSVGVCVCVCVCENMIEESSRWVSRLMGLITVRWTKHPFWKMQDLKFGWNISIQFKEQQTDNKSARQNQFNTWNTLLVTSTLPLCLVLAQLSAQSHTYTLVVNGHGNKSIWSILVTSPASLKSQSASLVIISQMLKCSCDYPCQFAISVEKINWFQIKAFLLDCSQWIGMN